MVTRRPTPYYLLNLALLTVAAAFFCASGARAAGNPIEMSVTCREKAAHTFRVRMPDVDVKYEGQRLDGTQPVNGTAYVGGKPRTFQCEFDRRGRKMLRFRITN